MTQRWIILGILGLGGAALADAGPRPPSCDVAAAIRSVTVYSDRARVTRRSDAVALPAGKLRFSVKGLPAGLDDDSVRISFPDAPELRVLSVEVERQFQDRFTSAEAKQREEAVKALEEEGRRLAAREAALVREAELLQGLSVGAQPHAGDQPQPKALSPDTWGKVLDAVAQGLADNAKARLEAGRSRRGWQRRLDAARQALSEVQSYHRRAEKVATVEVDAGTPGERRAALELSYLIAGARWTPSYDVRVLPEAPQIQVARYAVVEQRTGEDWAEAALVCSTAVPAVSATLPDLMAWKIGEAPRPVPPAVLFAAPETAARSDAPNAKPSGRRGKDKRREQVVEELSKAEGSLRDFQNDLKEANAPGEADVIEADGAATGEYGRTATAGKGGGRGWAGTPWIPPCVLAGGYDYAFPALKPETVKSDGRPSRIALGTDAFPAQLSYEAAPLVSAYAFLTCDLKNSSAAPFLGGTAHIFLAGDFLGEAALKTVAVGETVPVPLGVDEKIKVVRKDREVKGASGLFRTKEKTDTVVEISATSFLKAPIRLRILDRAPYSFQDDIQVEVADVSPATAEAPKKGLMIWDLALQPGQPRTVTFTYGVRTPEDFDLNPADDAEGAR